jgi:chromosome segregation ATPase
MDDKVLRWLKQYPGNDIVIDYIKARESEIRDQAKRIADIESLKADAYEAMEIARRRLSEVNESAKRLAADNESLSATADAAQKAIGARYEEVARIERELGKLTGAYDQLTSENRDLKADVQRLESDAAANAKRIANLSKVIASVKEYVANAGL